MECQQVVKEESGIYTVYVNFIEDLDGSILGKKSFQGHNVEELKDVIRPAWTKQKDNYDQKAAWLLIANQALDELEAES